MSVPPASPAPARALSWTRGLLMLLCVLLLLVAAGLGLLALGLFSSLSSNGPLWLRSLGVVASTVTGAVGLGGLSGLNQAFVLMVVTSAISGVAALVKPRP